MEPTDLKAHLEAELRIEIRERLVHEDERRLGDDRPRERDALLLAARQLSGIATSEAAELDEVERAADPAFALPSRDPADLETEADVARDAEVREKGVVLEDHAEATALRRVARDVPAIDLDGAFIGVEQPGDAVERRGLAAPGGTEEADELAAGDLQVEVTDGRRVREMLRQIADTERPQLRRAHCVLPAPTLLSQMSNAVTSAFVSSGVSIGSFLMRSSKSGRTTDPTASWLSFGAIASVTFLTAGPG